MIVETDRHIEAATAILNSKNKGQTLLSALSTRPVESFQFIAAKGSGIKRAVLIVKNAGSTATFLATEPLSKSDIKNISKLIREGVQLLNHHETTIAQTIMRVGSTLLKQAFKSAGFSTLANLMYMECTRLKELDSRNIDQLTFVSMDQRDDNILGSIMLQTYDGSLDCPKIHGLRSVQDIIDGHRKTEHYNAQLWSIAELDGRPVGVLLLNPTTEPRCIELAYLGVAPWARNEGIARAIMNHCVAEGKKFGFSKITLAVDADNFPAVGLYKKWNFHISSVRLAMIQKLSTHC